MWSWDTWIFKLSENCDNVEDYTRKFLMSWCKTRSVTDTLVLAFTVDSEDKACQLCVCVDVLICVGANCNLVFCCFVAVCNLHGQSMQHKHNQISYSLTLLARPTLFPLESTCISSMHYVKDVRGIAECCACSALLHMSSLIITTDRWIAQSPVTCQSILQKMIQKLSLLLFLSF